MAALTSGKTISGKLSWLMPANMQEIGFKPTPGGYVFKAPSPILFGKSRHVLLTEAQKSEILAMRPSPRQTALGFVMAIVIGIGIVLSARAPLIGIGVAAMLAAIAFFSNRRYARMIEPVVAKAQPTELRITFMDRVKRQAALWPMKGLITFAVLHTLMFALQATVAIADRSEPASDTNWLPYIGMALFGFFALYMAMLIAVRMQSRTRD
jgi:hypothetical protein